MQRALAQVAVVVAAIVLAAPETAHAASALDGTTMSWPWAVPFAGLLMTIACGPLLFPHIWHAHYGKIAAAWAALAIVPMLTYFGTAAAVAALAEELLGEYLSFIVLLFTLYTVAGGIVVSGSLRGTPIGNTALLATGTMMASVVGTTGAAMILIRPLLRALQNRENRAHVVVFFIVLVANVGGALTPLGDPPLFVGFLHGVDFFWTAKNLWMQTLLVAAWGLVLFFLLDRMLARRETPSLQPASIEPLRISGIVNIGLIALVIAAILGSAMWRPGVSVPVLGTVLELQNIARDAALLLLALASWLLTAREHREANGFTWEPIREVAKLFAAIFVTIIPVLAMLKAGRDGPFALLLTAVTANDGLPHEAAYFWLTGILSSLLDNAPTYLVFFELAGGDAQKLMGPLAGTLAAISMGAVYMGALSYIGNAPNLMVYAIAKDRGINMPSFFAYMLWASLILMPLFVILTFLPIAPLLKFG